MGALGSLPIGSSPLILSLDGTAAYRFWDRGAGGADVYLGVGYDRIDFEDRQTVPNHVEVGMGPMVVGGLRVSF